MKAYRRYSTAVKEAGPTGFIVRIGTASNALYVPVSDSEEIALISMTKKNQVGHVTVPHLQRLGNANWATPRTFTEWSKEQATTPA